MPDLDLGPKIEPPRPIPPHILAKFEKHRIHEETRQQMFGQVREPLHIPEFAGHRFVGVRNRLYFSKKWKFFSDFLFEYGLSRFGKDWVDAQVSLPPEQQHPLHKIRREACEYINAQERLPDGGIRAHGTVLVCNNFYYDLFTVDDNGLLNDELLVRLKHRDQFQGAMHELFAQATCLRAGFSIILEDERDRTRRHAEFIAVHKSTGQHVLVEAKSRHRAGVLGQPGVEHPVADIRFHRLINDAVTKDPTSPLAIFVDTNLPPERADRFYVPESTTRLLPSRALASLLDRVRKDYGELDPYNLLVFSNHPQHYVRTNHSHAPSRMAAILSERPRIKIYNKEALVDLLKAANLYRVVPTHFPPDRNSE